MTLEALASVLESTGLPVTYLAWPEGSAPPLPFICYLVASTNNLFADGQVYLTVQRIHVELYTKVKDLDAESRVENALREIPWQKSETYLNTEKCYQILYEIEV